MLPKPMLFKTLLCSFAGLIVVGEAGVDGAAFLVKGPTLVAIKTVWVG
jgi:hypothetical protein